ncbi:MAG: pilus assembly protein TadG-related protein [Planctomycetales bacterium]
MALWFLLVSPLFLAALVMVADLGYLWLTRIELENAVAAAALAGARSPWDGVQTDEGRARRDAARAAAARYLQANTVAGTNLQLHSAGATPPPEDRALLVEREVLLGDVDLAQKVFHLAPRRIANRGCHVNAIVEVDSLCLGIEGLYSLEAAATAVNEGDEVNVYLVRVEAFEP